MSFLSKINLFLLIFTWANQTYISNDRSQYTRDASTEINKGLMDHEHVHHFGTDLLITQ